MSRYMRYPMWALGVDPLVLTQWHRVLRAATAGARADAAVPETAGLAHVLGKVARWDPDELTSLFVPILESVPPLALD